MKIILLFTCITALAVNARLVKRSAKNEYKMCVPEDLMSYCEDMVKQETKSTVKIICIPARDRIECIHKIQKRLADFGTVDPEDMYIAGNVKNNDFRIFEEIRTREEPEAEFRYEGVAVIHKDLDLAGGGSIQQGGLKGLRSCHTGVGRNVGYKIPLTKLKNMGAIGPLNEPDMSPRENELKAFSGLFAKACIVGKWSPDEAIDAKLKKKYSNLCQLCEHPEKCDYPDNFSGYDGALRCLAHNGGQIAWTKVIYVRKFFGLPVGVTPAKETNENPDDYAYLCPDGTRVPVKETPCRWAARPWQGFMTNAAVVKNVDELRRKIENLNAEGYKQHSEWLLKLLDITDKNIAKESKIIDPKDHLDKANYTDVIERDYGPPYKVVKFCTTSQDELAKCRDFSDGAFSRNVRPRFDCVLEKDCLKAIRDNAADVKTLSPDEIKSANDFDLKPIVSEDYGGPNYAVAIVKKSSGFLALRDLKGAKSCHTNRKYPGFYTVVNSLIKLDLLKKPPKCSLSTAFADFFGGSCFPGVNTWSIFEEADGEKLCGACKGVGKAKCAPHKSEPYFGGEGALKCLQEGGDVAFVESQDLNKIIGSKDEYLLLCANGETASVDEFSKCNLGKVPPNMVFASNSRKIEDTEEMQHAILSANDLYKKRSDWFKLFGEYNGKSDLLFSDKTVDLKSVPADFSLVDIIDEIKKSDNFCGN